MVAIHLRQQREVAEFCGAGWGVLFCPGQSCIARRQSHADSHAAGVAGLGGLVGLRLIHGGDPADAAEELGLDFAFGGHEVHQLLGLIVREEFADDRVHVHDALGERLRSEDGGVEMAEQFHAGTNGFEYDAPRQGVLPRGHADGDAEGVGLHGFAGEGEEGFAGGVLRVEFAQELADEGRRFAHHSNDAEFRAAGAESTIDDFGEREGARGDGLGLEAELPGKLALSGDTVEDAHEGNERLLGDHRVRGDGAVGGEISGGTGQRHEFVYAILGFIEGGTEGAETDAEGGFGEGHDVDIGFLESGGEFGRIANHLAFHPGFEVEVVHDKAGGIRFPTQVGVFGLGLGPAFAGGNENLVEAGEVEDAVDGFGGVMDEEAAALGTELFVEGDEQADAGGADVLDAGEVEGDVAGPGGHGGVDGLGQVLGPVGIHASVDFHVGGVGDGLLVNIHSSTQIWAVGWAEGWRGVCVRRGRLKAGVFPESTGQG